MAWLGTVADADRITLSVKSVVREIVFQSGTGGTVVTTGKQYGTVTTYQWRGLDQTAAEAYVGSHSSDAGVEELVSERSGEGGQYCVTRVEVIAGTFGSWSTA
jgi:hypothetical protein